MNFLPLEALPAATLTALAASLRGGTLSVGISRMAVEQMVGEAAVAVTAALRGAIDEGLNSTVLADLIDAIARARNQTGVAAELVLSGPTVPDVPMTDTWPTVQGLVDSAETEVLMVGYAVANGKRIFARLAERMRMKLDLKVRLHLDISRKLGDTSLDSEIVLRFLMDFSKRHWPGDRLPDIYYLPAALDPNPKQRAVLHAKCIIVDRRVALITSANFTEAAQLRNIEAGVLLRDPIPCARLASYLDGLIACKTLRPASQKP